ncbi:MAG: type II toxin-antitoxin system RelE/ParE family toxin [Kiritimatiellae bacterium]|jgi:plasmid stabilization system protein ParE|nr:type II toxin-antitoxin system RelE/ParE family toxin [Kiritimatiellia bacterium]
MKRVTFHEDADAELIEAARYYEARTPSLGLALLLDIEDAVEQIQANPEAFPLVGTEVRHKLLRRFPYSVMYAIEPDRIRVVAVAHQRRRPSYWLHRLT